MVDNRLYKISINRSLEFFDSIQAREDYLKFHGRNKPLDKSGNFIQAGDLVQFISTGEFTDVLEIDCLGASVRVYLKSNQNSTWQYGKNFFLL